MLQGNLKYMFQVIDLEKDKRVEFGKNSCECQLTLISLHVS